MAPPDGGHQGTDEPRRGRPADPRLDDALRAATRRVIAEHGWRGTTIERIADYAGVARTTIYRRHGSMHGVLMLLMSDVYARIPIEDTGTLRGDLVLMLDEVVQVWREPANVDYFAALVAAQRESGDVASAYEDSRRGRRQITTGIITRAIARGELAAGTDPEFVLDLVTGIVVQRALLHQHVPTAGFAELVVDAVLDGVRPR